MSVTFTKLFSSITESTIWTEDAPTRVVWVTMLAMADRAGRVWASIPGLANRARVTLPECEKALNKFLSPDKYSRTKDHEGRRIEEIDGGWRLINYQKYRDIRDAETTREQATIRKRRQRMSRDVTLVTPGHDNAEAEAEAEADISTSLRSVDIARGTRLPPGWVPDHWDEIEQLAHSETLAEFRDYWIAQPGVKGRKTDWNATWRNWLRRNRREGHQRASAKLSAVERVKRDSDEWARRRQNERAVVEDGELVRTQVEQPIRIGARRTMDPSDSDVGF